MVKKKTAKPKRPSKSKLLKKADNIFSKYIRLRDADKHWVVKCPLCWARMPRKQSQNMHFIKRACWLYRFDETNCHAGCYRCNVKLHWNYIEYTRYMIAEYWLDYVDKMRKESKKIHKEPKLYDYENIIETYTNKIIDFSKKLTA